MQYNPVAAVAVSVDEGRMVEYWAGPRGDYQFPRNLSWESKIDTDLYEFLKVISNVTFDFRKGLHIRSYFQIFSTLPVSNW